MVILVCTSTNSCDRSSRASLQLQLHPESDVGRSIASLRLSEFLLLFLTGAIRSCSGMAKNFLEFTFPNFSPACTNCRQRFELASIITYVEFQWSPAPLNRLWLPLHSPPRTRPSLPKKHDGCWLSPQKGKRMFAPAFEIRGDQWRSR